MNQGQIMPEQGQRANAMKKHMLLGALLAAFGMAGAAHADDDDCQVPMERWQPREAVQDAVKARGWQVGRIKIDDGCYEVRGNDAQGAAFKAKLDPATLEVVEMKRKDRRGEGRDDDDDDDHGPRQARERSQGAPLTAPPANLPPPGGLLGNGTPPAVVVR